MNVIYLDAEAWGAFLALLDEPQDNPKLNALLTTPTVFDGEGA